MHSIRSVTYIGYGLFIASFIGVIIRIHFAAEPLWIDELHTAWTIDAALQDVSVRAGQGNQTPLYFWISWLACSSIGLSELTLRLPAIIFSTAAIVWSGVFVWRYSNNAGAAVTTALLIALDHWFVFYGTEARPYALLQLLSVAQVDFLANELFPSAKADKKSNSFLTGHINWPLVIATSALLATHLTSVFLLAAELLFLLARPQAINRKRVFVSILIACTVLVFVLPTAISTFQKRADWLSVSNIAQLYYECWTALFVYFLVPTVVLVSSLLFKHKHNTLTRHHYAGVIPLVFCWGFGPLLIVCLLDWLSLFPVAAYRYALAGSAAFPIFSGLAISRIGNRRIETISAFAIIALALIFNPIVNDAILNNRTPQFRMEDWKSAINQLNEETVGKTQLIFLFANLVEDHRANQVSPDSAFHRYLRFPLTGIYKPTDGSTIVPMPTLTKLHWHRSHLDQIRQNGGAQVITRVDPKQRDKILAELKHKALELSMPLQIEVRTQLANNIAIASIHLKIENHQN